MDRPVVFPNGHHHTAESHQCDRSREQLARYVRLFDGLAFVESRSQRLRKREAQEPDRWHCADEDERIRQMTHEQRHDRDRRNQAKSHHGYRAAAEQQREVTGAVLRCRARCWIA